MKRFLELLATILFVVFAPCVSGYVLVTQLGLAWGLSASFVLNLVTLFFFGKYAEKQRTKAIAKELQTEVQEARLSIDEAINRLKK